MSGNQDKVRRRAYELWEAEGRPQGRDIDHWLRAEAELAAAKAAPVKKAPARKAPAKRAAAKV